MVKGGSQKICRTSGNKKENIENPPEADCPMFSGGEKNRSMNVSAVIGKEAVLLNVETQKIVDG